MNKKKVEPTLTAKGSKKRAWMKYDALKINTNGVLTFIRKGKRIAYFDVGDIQSGDILTISDLHGLLRLEKS